MCVFICVYNAYYLSCTCIKNTCYLSCMCEYMLLKLHIYKNICYLSCISINTYMYKCTNKDNIKYVYSYIVYTDNIWIHSKNSCVVVFNINFCSYTARSRNWIHTVTILCYHEHKIVSV